MKIEQFFFIPPSPLNSAIFFSGGRGFGGSFPSLPPPNDLSPLLHNDLSPPQAWRMFWGGQRKSEKFVIKK